MNVISSAGASLLLAGLLGVADASHAQQWNGEERQTGHDIGIAAATSNLPSGSGEASTMTNGVPNLLASNPQPGELGIQSRMTVRPATRFSRSRSDLNVMGAPAAPSQQQSRPDQ